MSARPLACLAAAAIVASASWARADEPPTAPEQPPPADSAAFSLKAAGGPAYRGFYSTHLTGGDLQIALGSEFRHLGIYGTADALFARTEYGLTAQTIQLGAVIEAIVGRFRIGGGLQLGYLSIARASATTDAMFGVGAGGNLFASIDLLRFGPHALFLTGKVSLDCYGGSLSLIGPTGLLGFRY